MPTNLAGVLMLEGVPHDLTIQPQDTQEEPPVPVPDPDIPLAVVATDGFVELDFSKALNFEVQFDADEDIHFLPPKDVLPGKGGVIRVINTHGKPVSFGSGWVRLNGQDLGAAASGLPAFLVAYYAPTSMAVFATVIKVGG